MRGDWCSSGCGDTGCPLSYLVRARYCGLGVGGNVSSSGSGLAAGCVAGGEDYVRSQ